VYACGNEFYRSTNGGATWTKITSGLPAATAVQRMAIAVTAANTAYIYLVAMKSATYDIQGVYRSTNSGTSFTTLSTNSPNIGNQGWYDLCIAANPSNAQEVMLGGQTQFMKTTNGGTSWSQPCWSRRRSWPPGRRRGRERRPRRSATAPASSPWPGTPRRRRGRPGKR